jgi:hypothetical protein
VDIITCKQYRFNVFEITPSLALFEASGLKWTKQPSNTKKTQVELIFALLCFLKYSFVIILDRATF